MPELPPELQALQDAVQNLVNARSEEPTVVHTAIVVWEEMTFDREGEPYFEIYYSMPSVAVSMASAVGLLRAGQVKLEQEIRNDMEEE